MENRLLALKLFLDELEVPPSIRHVDDRKRVQKAVYLGQLTGVDLGYRFGWYLMGPYSPSLTKDYYALADALAAEESGEGKELRPELAAKLRAARSLMDSRINGMTQENWLELLASIHYLRNVSHLSDPEARKVFAKEKPHLSAHYDIGQKALLESHLGTAV